jgi:hypothetical protein
MAFFSSRVTVTGIHPNANSFFGISWDTKEEHDTKLANAIQNFIAPNQAAVHAGEAALAALGAAITPPDPPPDPDPGT